MDYIIFRRATNEFMRWSDGKVFVTNDEEDIDQQFHLELAENTNPTILTLEYDGYFDSEGQEHQGVTIKENGTEIGFFNYKSHFDDDDEFADALESWAKEYVSDNKTN